MKIAIGPPGVVVKAVMMLVTVETVARLSVLTAVGATIGTVEAGTVFKEVVDSGEHPKKSGMLTLYVAHRARSNAKAAMWWLDYCVLR